MWGRIYENYMTTFSKAHIKPEFVHDQNEYNRMNLSVYRFNACVAYIVSVYYKTMNNSRL